jgi:hypothetical protein
MSLYRAMFKWLSDLKKRSGLKIRSTKTGYMMPKSVFALILALDIYLIYLIFQGMGWSGEKITPPSERITHTLLGFANNPAQLLPNAIALVPEGDANRNWGTKPSPTLGAFLELKRGRGPYAVDNLYYDLPQGRAYRQYSIRWEQSRGLGSDKIAKEAQALFNERWASLEDFERQLDRYNNQIIALNQEIVGLVSNYDTMLREKGAGLASEKSLMPVRADDVLAKIRSKRESLSALIALRAQVVEAITSDLKPVLDWMTVNREEVFERYRQHSFWYEFFVELAKIAFVLPVFIFGVLWHRANVRKPQAEVAVLISSHLVYIAAIPIIFRFFRVVWDILPFHIFAQLFEMLWRMGLQYIWSYALIAAGIGIFFAIARWVISHRQKSKATYFMQCLALGLCPKTGRRLPFGCRYSPYTGEPLMKPAEDGSGQESYRYAPYCSQSGKPNSEWEKLIK